MTDLIPVADYVTIAQTWLLYALFALAVITGVRAVRSAYLAEQSAANQAAWTATLPQCGLCHNRRALTDATVQMLDGPYHDDGIYCRRYTVRVCSDCAALLTSHEQEKAA